MKKQPSVAYVSGPEFETTGRKLNANKKIS